MSKVKLLVIGDVHICDHSPGRRQEGYKDHILNKLEECVDIARREEVTHVLFLGDIFHLKAANRVSHRLVQEMSQLFSRFKVPVVILVGNHDITDGSLESIVKQPIGVFRFVPNVELLHTEPVSLDADINIYPVPGVSEVTIDDFRVSKKNKRDIMAVHQSIVPELEKENEILHDILFDAKEVAEVTDIGIILYGHQHRYDGVYPIVRDNGTKAVFSNLGSISRLTVNEEDVRKVPSVLLLEFDDDEARTVTPQVIKLEKVVPAHEAYRLEEHQEEKDRSQDIEETIRKLKETEVSAYSVESVISDVSVRKDIDKPVKETALSLLEDVK